MPLFFFLVNKFTIFNFIFYPKKVIKKARSPPPSWLIWSFHNCFQPPLLASENSPLKASTLVWTVFSTGAFNTIAPWLMVPETLLQALVYQPCQQTSSLLLSSSFQTFPNGHFPWRCANSCSHFSTEDPISLSQNSTFWTTSSLEQHLYSLSSLMGRKSTCNSGNTQKI